MNLDKNVKNINALTKTYNLILWIIPVLEKYPRTQRYLIADKIENALLHILELLITAINSKEKVEYLQKANLEIEKLRYLIRLSSDMKYVTIKKYEYIINSLQQIGSEIGGWLKFSKTKYKNYINIVEE